MIERSKNDANATVQITGGVNDDVDVGGVAEKKGIPGKADISLCNNIIELRERINSLEMTPAAIAQGLFGLGECPGGHGDESYSKGWLEELYSDPVAHVASADNPDANGIAFLLAFL